MNVRVAAALVGFLVLALSPSFVDWQQATGGQRREIAVYYSVALALIYVGVLRD